MLEKKLNDHINAQYPKLKFDIEMYISFIYINDYINPTIEFYLSLNTLGSASDQDRIISKSDIDDILYTTENTSLSYSDIGIFMKKLSADKWRIEVIKEGNDYIDYINITSREFKNPLQYKKHIKAIIKIYKEIIVDKDINACFET